MYTPYQASPYGFPMDRYGRRMRRGGGAMANVKNVVLIIASIFIIYNIIVISTAQSQDENEE